MWDKNTINKEKKTINAGGRLLIFDRPKIMGIINTTPDSFFSGSRADSASSALKKAEEMLSEGADILDLGGYSSRPGASDIPAEEELSRVLPVIKEIVRTFPEALISIDTFRASVASAAVQEGAHMINDISGGELDPTMFETVAKLQVPYILMHMKGSPQTMKSLNQYEDLIPDILLYFAEKIRKLTDSGVKDIIADPGFGFAKNIGQNYQLLEGFDSFKILGVPLLAGLSRKSMIWKVLDIPSEEALNGTTVLNTIAVQKGADILRVHDVKAAAEVIKLTGLVLKQGLPA